LRSWTSEKEGNRLPKSLYLTQYKKRVYVRI